MLTESCSIAILLTDRGLKTMQAVITSLFSMIFSAGSYSTCYYEWMWKKGPIYFKACWQLHSRGYVKWKAEVEPSGLQKEGVDQNSSYLLHRN